MMVCFSVAVAGFFLLLCFLFLFSPETADSVAGIYSLQSGQRGIIALKTRRNANLTPSLQSPRRDFRGDRSPPHSFLHSETLFLTGTVNQGPAIYYQLSTNSTPPSWFALSQFFVIRASSGGCLPLQEIRPTWLPAMLPSSFNFIFLRFLE